MKKAKTIFILTIFLIFILLLMLSSMHAQTKLPPPEREITAIGDTDPYSVTLYGDKDYFDPLKTWKLQPGKRLLEVSSIQIDSQGPFKGASSAVEAGKIIGMGNVKDLKPFSILLGSKVGVLLFPQTEFRSHLKMENLTKKIVIGPLVKKVYGARLIPYMKIVASTPEISRKDLLTLASLIIYRKDIADVTGVLLQSGEDWTKFFPLPESPSHSSIIYKKIPSGGPFGLAVVPAIKKDNVQVIVESSPGHTAKLIEPGSGLASFHLDKMGIDQISSIKIIYKGPFGPSAYLPSQPKTHRAPPAPDIKPPVSATKGTGATSGRPIYEIARTFESGGSPKQITTPDIAGQWGSSVGFVYEITQKGNKFEWSVKNINEKGAGTVGDNTLSVSWSGQNGSGSAKGKITAVDGSGTATKIEWSNGVVFFKK